MSFARRPPAALLSLATTLAALACAATPALAYEAGDFDPSFSGDGKMQFRITGSDFATGVDTHKDKTIVSGSSGAPGGGLWTATRITEDGRLDRNFSRDGKATFRVPVGQQKPVNGGAADVTIQPDGKPILVGDTVTEGGAQRLAIARLTKQGKLDKSFSGNGSNAVGLHGTSAARAALQENGRIVVVGSAGGGNEWLIARFMPTGSLDRSFGSDGIVRADHLNGDHKTELGFDVAIQDDGKIVAAGRSQTGQDGRLYDGAVLRLNRDGSADESFSRDGFAARGLGGAETARAVGIQSDGTIILAGTTTYAGAGDGSADNDEFVTALTPEGAVDGSFGTGPGVTYFGYGGDDYIQDLAMSGDDIVVGGGPQDPHAAVVTRLLEDGEIDRSFAGGGAYIEEYEIPAIALSRGFPLVPFISPEGGGVFETGVARLYPYPGED